MSRLAFVAIIAALVRTAGSQGSTASQATPAAQPAKAEAQKPDQGALGRYILGPDDQLRITVFDEPDLTNIYRIGSDGFITFPLIDRVAASGLTIAEFQDRLRARLADGFIRNPQVRVEVEQYKSQYVIVGGEVRTPGRIAMTGTMTLPEALAHAGSPTSAASTEVVLTHAVKPNSNGTMPDRTPESLRINLKDLQLGRVGRDIYLQDGDTIFVPKAQIFFITGFVRNPGSLVWEPGMTVQQAIALAGGLTDRGSDRRITARRIMPDGKVAEVKLTLESTVEPNDTISVPAKIF